MTVDQMIGQTVIANRDLAHTPTWRNRPGIPHVVIDSWWQNGEGWYRLESPDGERFDSPDVFWCEATRCGWCWRCGWCCGRQVLDAATGEPRECSRCDHGWSLVE